jgi:hypothetical protein
MPSEPPLVPELVERGCSRAEQLYFVGPRFGFSNGEI